MSRFPALTAEFAEFLELCPSIVLLFEIDGYRILAANSEAARKYGHSQEELAEMSIMDLRPPEDMPRIARLASRLMDGSDAAGRSRHLKKDGTIFTADVRTKVMQVNGRFCKLATIHDVTEQVAQEEASRTLMAEAAARARQADQTARHFAELFDFAPGRCAILRPDTFEVVAATDGYLAALGSKRAEVVGQPLFGSGSDEGQRRNTDLAEPLRASLQNVARLAREDVMQDAVLPSASRLTTGAPATTWKIVNKPVMAPGGTVTFILHSLAGVGDSADHDADTATELLKSENTLLSRRLAESEALFRTTTNLLKAHVWRIDLENRQLEGTDRLFELFGLPLQSTALDFDTYAAMVHPDDREAMLANYLAHSDGAGTHFEFAHRIVRPDGQIVHLKGAAERIIESGRIFLSGVVEDVSAAAELKAAADRQDFLLNVAGRVGRIGGWRVDLSTRISEWSVETARIHESPETRQVGLTQALAFYPPDYFDLITDRFNACATLGTAFDEVMQIVTLRGNRVWVRVVAAPERDATGQIVAVQGAFQDISEVVQLHQQGNELRDRLSRSLENMSDAFFTLDQSWQFSFVNSRAEILFQRKRQDLLGRSIWAEYPDAVGSRFETEYRRAVETGNSVKFDAFFPPLALWFRVNAYPSADGLAVYLRDVTREHARDQHLRLLDAAVARMNDILLITEAAPIDAPDGPRIIFANKAFERLIGYATDEVIGLTPRFLQGPDTDRAELDRIRTALERNEPVRAEVINYSRAGREYWLDMDITPLADETGRTTHFVALQRDTTEQRRAEAQLRLSEERFRLINEATKDVIWDWDIPADRFWWNDNLQKVFGYEPAEFSARSAGQNGLIHPDDAERIATGLRALVDGTENAWQDDYRVFRADGRTAYVHDRAVALRDHTGKALRVLGSMADVTSARDSGMALRQSQKLEAIGQLTGGLAHDFNNLLTVIMGNSELLADSLPDDSELRRMAEMAFSAAERGSELTARLLSFARKQALEPKVIDLNSQVVSIVPLMRRSLGESIEIQVKLADDLWLTEIDAAQFEAALLNLSLNARDAMPSGGKLMIETANAWFDAETAAMIEIEEGRFVSVAVSDTGIGMPPAVVERALEPFFTTKNKGTGLGLPMAFGFAKQSGGHLKIYSEVGEGTTLKMYFPRSATTGVPESEELDLPTIPLGKNEHILVVEDDPFVRQHVIATIQSLGYRISEAENASIALELLAAADDIVLLFTDIVMPGGMNGRELADIALQRHPDLCVLYTSGYTENAVVHQGRLDPGVELLSKPYKRQDLAQKLRAVLDQAGLKS